MYKKLIIIGFFLWACSSVFAQEALYRDRALDVIDIPTANVLDHYGYQVSFRFGKEGALQNKNIFGIFPRLNLGFGLDGEQVLGTEDADLNKPTLNVKFRFFDGQGILPALAIGFDGQGYYFNEQLDEYDQREKGVFLVATEEIIWPELQLHLGVDKFDFDESNTTRGFAGFTYTYQQMLGLLFEYDNATEYDERRINFGLKYFVTPLFTVEALGRDVPVNSSTDKRETERVVRLTYKGTF